MGKTLNVGPGRRWCAPALLLVVCSLVYCYYLAKVVHPPPDGSAVTFEVEFNALKARLTTLALNQEQIKEKLHSLSEQIALKGNQHDLKEPLVVEAEPHGLANTTPLLASSPLREPHNWGGIREDTHCGANWPDDAGKFGACATGECCSDEHWCGKSHGHCGCPGCMPFPIAAPPPADSSTKTAVLPPVTVLGMELPPPGTKPFSGPNTVDLVIPWVNTSHDPWIRANLEASLRANEDAELNAQEKPFAYNPANKSLADNFIELKYVLRSCKAHGLMKYVRHIHIVHSDLHPGPSYLDGTHPKLSFVPHSKCACAIHALYVGNIGAATDTCMNCLGAGTFLIQARFQASTDGRFSERWPTFPTVRTLSVCFCQPGH